MRTFQALLCAICLTALVAEVTEAAPAENQLTPQEAAEGWQLLFDGTAMEHFRSYNLPDINSDMNGGWIVEDQSMVLTARGGGDLITRESWSDFELALDWWVEAGGNSGVFFLADEGDLPIYMHAPEVQILDNERHADRKQADRRSGSLYDMIAAPAASQKPAEEWNTLIIRHQAGHLQTWQNDVKTVDIHIGSLRWHTLLSASKFKTWPGFGENSFGHIGLQDHGDRVAFRNLKIRSLGTAQ